MGRFSNQDETCRRVVAPLALLGLMTAAFWPVWSWCVRRMGDTPEDRWGVLPLATALVFLGRSPKRELRGGSLILPALVTVFYAATYAFVPPLARGVVAIVALGFVLSAYTGVVFHTGLFGLLTLSLPLIPSLQFYAGYPLRSLVAHLAAPLIQLSGFAVIREGTCLNWAGQIIWIDAPCSGVKMIWAGFYLCFSLSCFHGLNSSRTFVAGFACLLAVIVGNVLRSVALFYLESGAVQGVPWMHEGVGVVGFAMAAFLAFVSVSVLRRMRPCVPCTST